MVNVLSSEVTDLRELRAMLTGTLAKVDGILKRADHAVLRQMQTTLVEQHRALGRLIEP